MEELKQLVGDYSERNIGLVKLCQFEVFVGLLVTMHGRYHLFSWPVPIPLFAMGRTTAEVYWQLLDIVMEILSLQQFSTWLDTCGGFP